MNARLGLLTRVAAAAGAIVLAASVAAAQTTGGVLMGTVVDEQAAVLPGATVTVTNTNTGATRTVVTDSRGYYRAAALVPGPYEMRLELTGFETIVRTGLVLTIGEEVTLGFAMKLGSVAETLTITGESPLVETSKNAIGGTVSRAELDNVPIPARDYTQLANTAPGIMGVASPGFGAGITTGSTVSAAGELNRNNTFMIDGVSNDDLVSASSRGGISLEAVQEYVVLTSQFSAESGQATGAVVSIVTRSGTNQLQGRAFLLARDTALNARDYFSQRANTEKAPFNQQQFGGFAGGPIVRDKMHFFAAYEMLRTRTASVITSPLVPVDERQNPFDTNQHLPFMKFDWQVNPKHTASIRYRVDHRTQVGGGIGGLNSRERGWDSRQRSQDFGGSLTSVVSAHALNEFRIQYQPTLTFFDVLPYAPTPNAPQITRPSGGFGKGQPFPQDNYSDYTRLLDNFSYTVGRHNIKTGVSVDLLTFESNFLSNQDGTFNFATDAPFNSADRSTYPTQFSQTLGERHLESSAQVYGFFAQDSWRLTNALTINAGLRYDVDTAWSRSKNIRVADASTGSEPVLRDVSDDRNNFAPRLGFAWAPGSTGKLAIRGGFGLYVDQSFLNVPSNVSRATTSRSITIVNPGYPDSGSGGTVGGSRQSTTVVAPDISTPVSRTASIGVEHEILKGVAVAADYVNTRARDLVFTNDVNYPDPVTRVRPNPNYLAVSRFQMTGNAWSNALLMRVERRPGRGPSFRVSYTLSKAERDVEDFQFIAQDMNDLAAEKGPANNDRRHQLVALGTQKLPWGFQVSAYFAARSALPFTITTGRDNNGDTNINDRPDLLNPNGDPLDRATYDFTFTGHTGNLGRNTARGPAFAQLDLRLSNVARFGSRRLEGFFEVFNVTNRANLATPVSNLASASFGLPTTISGTPRQAEFGIRFDF